MASSTLGLYPITVDSREKLPSPDARVQELARIGVQAKIDLLPVGDYQWVACDETTTNFVVVERKTIPDFLGSIGDGRISRFIEETGGATGTPNLMRCLLLEGDQFVYANYGHRNWTPEQVDDALVSIQQFGVVVVRSASSLQTAKRLAALYHWTGSEHRSMTAIARPDLTGAYIGGQVRDAVRFLMGMPGWGEKRAVEAIKEFKSAEAVIDAVRGREYKRFKNVRGVSKGLVDQAANFLAEEVA